MCLNWIIWARMPTYHQLMFIEAIKECSLCAPSQYLHIYIAWSRKAHYILLYLLRHINLNENLFQEKFSSSLETTMIWFLFKTLFPITSRAVWHFLLRKGFFDIAFVFTFSRVFVYVVCWENFLFFFTCRTIQFQSTGKFNCLLAKVSKRDIKLRRWWKGKFLVKWTHTGRWQEQIDLLSSCFKRTVG